METGLRPVLPDHRKGHGEAQDTGRGASPDSETRPKRDLGQARQAPGCEGRDVAGGGRAPGPPSRLTPDALRGAAFQQPLAADPTSRPRNVACAPESSLHAPLSVSDSPRVLQGSRWGSRLVTVLSRARAEQAWQTWGSSEPGPALCTRTPLPSQPAQSHGPGTSFGYCRRPPRWPGEAPARTRAGEQQRWGPPPPFTADWGRAPGATTGFNPHTQGRFPGNIFIGFGGRESGTFGSACAACLRPPAHGGPAETLTCRRCERRASRRVQKQGGANPRRPQGGQDRGNGPGVGSPQKTACPRLRNPAKNGPTHSGGTGPCPGPVLLGSHRR